MCPNCAPERFPACTFGAEPLLVLHRLHSSLVMAGLPPRGAARPIGACIPRKARPVSKALPAVGWSPATLCGELTALRALPGTTVPAVVGLGPATVAAPSTVAMSGPARPPMARMNAATAQALGFRPPVGASIVFVELAAARLAISRRGVNRPPLPPGTLLMPQIPAASPASLAQSMPVDASATSGLVLATTWAASSWPSVEASGSGGPGGGAPGDTGAELARALDLVRALSPQAPIGAGPDFVLAQSTVWASSRHSLSLHWSPGSEAGEMESTGASSSNQAWQSPAGTAQSPIGGLPVPGSAQPAPPTRQLASSAVVIGVGVCPYPASSHPAGSSHSSHPASPMPQVQAAPPASLAQSMPVDASATSGPPASSLPAGSSNCSHPATQPAA